MKNTFEGMEIRLDDLQGAAIQQLLRAHRQNLALHSPPESCHVLDLESLRQPEIALWSAWRGEALLGCGALKALDAQHGEVKSMRTANDHLRQGVAAALLAHIIQAARQRGYTRLSLETGMVPAFDPARRLYERFGFTYTTPFADYVEDPYSVFMTMAL